MSYYENYKNPKGFLGKIALLKMNYFNSKAANYGLSFIEIGPHYNCLDIGCGGGRNIKEISKKNCNGIVAGIDISSLAINLSKKVNKASMHKLDLKEGNVDDIPFNDNSFDVITAFETIYFWPDITKCFKEVYRVLKPSGKFAILCQISDPREKIVKKISDFKIYTRKQLKDILISTGFKDIEIHFNSKHWVCAVGGK